MSADSKRHHFVAKYGSTAQIDAEMDRQLADPNRIGMDGKPIVSPKFVEAAFHHNKHNLSPRFVNYIWEHGSEQHKFLAATHEHLSDKNLAQAVVHPWSQIQTAAAMHKNVTRDQLNYLRLKGDNTYVRGLATRRVDQTDIQRVEQSMQWHKQG